MSEEQHLRTEAALRETQQRLEAELADSKLLQAVSAAAIQEEDVAGLYETIVDAVQALMRSDFASMQMVEHEGDVPVLRLLAFRGFTPSAARSWQTVRIGSTTSCGEALRL